jgi:hypothetical protein
MSAAAGFHTRSLTPAESFRASCAAAAADLSAGKIELIEAVDALQTWAETRCVLEEIGQDAVQAIMARVFASVSAAKASTTSTPHRGEMKK